MGTPSTQRLASRKRVSPIGDDSDVVKRHRVGRTSDKENHDNRSVEPQSPVREGDVAGMDEDIMASPLAGRHYNQAGKPPEAGVIKEIYCENFMCHRKLTVNLCRNVNFIYGQNGSGKSAILAAIQICLGAGARRTHRARNIKDLVRKDSTAPCAKIRVTLLNRGADGYHHEIYGDTITVERTIAVRGGYNGYKLYDHNMQEQSRSKKDLDDMLDKLNIQVENPVAILDQEEAKKFLTGKSSDKYNFFMKATELERIDRSYCVLSDKRDDLDKQLDVMKKSLTTDLDLVKETKRVYEQHLAIEKLEAQLYEYQENFAWAVAGEEKKTLEDETERINEYRQKAAKKQEELTQAEEEANAPDDTEQALQNKLDELNEEGKKQAALKRELEADLKRAVEPQKTAERQLKTLQKSEKKAQADLRKAKTSLQQKRDEIIAKEGSAESEAAKRAQRIQEAEDKLQGLHEKKDRLIQEETDSRRAYDELEPHTKQAKENTRAAVSKLKAIEHRLNGLRSSTGNSVAVFGRNCPKVKQLVDAERQKRRFKGEVVGPIGNYIKIAPGKEKLAALAESALGNGVLDRWIVTNDHDRKALQEIRKKAKCQFDCGIFQVSMHSKYNIPGPPVDGIETIASVLTISNDLVFNCLVDNSKIEERALSASKAESEKLLLKQGNNGQYSIVGGKIKNVCFLPQGDSWSIKNGNINMTANEKKLRQTIGVDRSAAISGTEQEAQAMYGEVKALEKEESKKEIELKEFQKTWNKAKKGLRDNQKETQKWSSLIDEIRSEEIDAENVDTDTTEYEQEVQEAQTQVQTLADQEKELREQIEESSPEIGELKARLLETSARNEKVMNDLQQTGEELTQYVHNVSQRQAKIEKKREKMKKYQEVVGKQDEKVIEIQSSVDKYVETARIIAFQRIKREERNVQDEEGEHPDDSQFTQEPTDEELESIEVRNVDHKSSYFEAKLNRIKKRIEEEKERRDVRKDDPVIAYEKYKRAKKQCKEKSLRCEEITNLIAMLKKDISDRKTRWKQFRAHISDMTSTKFDEMLNKKGSSGDIEFDHKNKELNLIVQKDSRDQNSQQRDVKALSGGERSFTTIALLLALGESLETPFRVLDEFDVFLDPVSRKLTIESLIVMAKSMEHRQFIFITPQDVSNVEVDPMLKVLKMTPPARNEVAGGLTQQTLDFASQP